MSNDFSRKTLPFAFILALGLGAMLVLAGCSEGKDERIMLDLNLDGGSFAYDSFELEFDSSYSGVHIPDEVPSKVDSYFQGWQEVHSGKTVLPGEILPIERADAHVSLVAQWREGEVEEAPFVTLYMNYPSGAVYDAVQTDWRCMEDANNTYWAIHNWYQEEEGNPKEGSGYAGFQNVNGVHKIILSIWDTPSGSPSVEFGLASGGGDFGNEGTGKHVVADYDWQVGTWYTTRIQAVREDLKTVYQMWIRPDGKEWEMVAAISYPKENLGFTYDCTFLEDFTSNNLRRSEQLKNFYARDSVAFTWVGARELTYVNRDRLNKESQNIAYDNRGEWNLNAVDVWSGGQGYELTLDSMPPHDIIVEQAEQPDCPEWL